MSRAVPSISVIVPTHNRCGSLRRLLDALGLQTYPLPSVEVVVVADGCRDDTPTMVRRYSGPVSTRVVEQHGLGAGAARNHGATVATGAILLFLDDDIEPASGLIEAHVRAHRDRQDRVALGYLPLVAPDPIDFFAIEVRSWWENQFIAMGRKGHRYIYRNLFSGNFSLRAELFKRVGGFDPSFQRREDYEFGMRLIKHRASFAFIADAIGHHHDTSSLDGSLQRVYKEGYSDVLLGERHPEVRPDLPLVNFENDDRVFTRIVHTLAFDYPRGGDWLASLLRRTLGPLERARLRAAWRRIFLGLRNYWYLRGAAEKLRRRRALLSFLQGGPPRIDQGGIEIEIDLADGINTAERRLDEQRPDGARLRYGKQFLGRIAPQAGAEALRGAHLRPILATDLAWPLARVLAMQALSSPSPTPLCVSATQRKRCEA